MESQLELIGSDMPIVGDPLYVEFENIVIIELKEID